MLSVLIPQMTKEQVNACGMECAHKLADKPRIHGLGNLLSLFIHSRIFKVLLKDRLCIAT